jgi:hypothetical protein
LVGGFVVDEALGSDVLEQLPRSPPPTEEVDGAMASDREQPADE